MPHLLYTPEENQPLPLGYAVVISPNGDRLNIRDGEGVDCGSMMQVVAGTVLPYYSNPRAEWVKVKAGNQMGYVMSEYLYLGEDMARVRPDTQVLSVQPDRGETQLKLLELPARSAMVLTLLDAGQPVVMLGAINEWTIVRAGLFTGYVLTQNLKPEIPVIRFSQDEEKDFNFSSLLPIGVQVSGVFKDEGAGAFTVFINMEFLENTYNDEVVGFDLYINHVYHSRVPFLKQDENNARAQIFSSEISFAHDIGAVTLVPVMHKGGQMRWATIHMDKATD